MKANIHKWPGRHLINHRPTTSDVEHTSKTDVTALSLITLVEVNVKSAKLGSAEIRKGVRFPKRSNVGGL